NYEAMMQRAAIRLVRGDMAGVLFELENAESYYERSPQVKYQLALAHLKQGDTFQAEEKVKEALRISPNYDEAILLLAELDLRRDNPGATVAALRELLRRRPDQPQAYLLLAQAHRSRGDLDLALEVLQ